MLSGIDYCSQYQEFRIEWRKQYKVLTRVIINSKKNIKELNRIMPKSPLLKVSQLTLQRYQFTARNMNAEMLAKRSFMYDYMALKTREALMIERSINRNWIV